MDYVTDDDKLLIVEDLKTYFVTKQGIVRAVDGVSFSVNRGEIVGLVGESGCGKSMTSFSILRLVPQPAGKIINGRIIFRQENLLDKTEEEMRKIRGNRISMIVQDAMVSLNPLLKVGYQLAEPLRYHNKVMDSLKDMCISLLARVKVPAPESRIRDYPFQFSGGMCQRTLIAMGISCDPDLLIADEPTTALDVTIQAQILKLLQEIRKEFNSSIIFITHDLAVVAQLCSRVMVMYAGRIVEKADIMTFFKKPAHPYSRGLIESVPVLKKRVDRLYTIDGHPPSLFKLPPGCRFAPRCTQAKGICAEEYPPEYILEDGHVVSCWLYE
ncbi:MAG: ABC transporter ATP-binding protein [Pseudomonadota bacterium]